MSYILTWISLITSEIEHSCIILFYIFLSGFFCFYVCPCFSTELLEEGDHTPSAKRKAECLGCHMVLRVTGKAEAEGVLKSTEVGPQVQTR